MPLAPLLTSSALTPVELDGDLAVSVGLEGSIQVGEPLSLDCDLVVSVGMDGALGVLRIVELAGDMSAAVGMEGELLVDQEMSGELAASIGMEGELLVSPAETQVAGDLTVGVGLSGTLSVGAALPATDWQWSAPEADPDLLETMRIKLATLDGEYTVVDPSEIDAASVELTRKGGLDTGALTLRRDSRLELGDLDYGTKLDIDYLGRTLHGWLYEAPLRHADAMTREVSFLGEINRLSKERQAFRRVYVDARLEAWKTDQASERSDRKGDEMNHYGRSSAYEVAYDAEADEIDLFALWDGVFSANDTTGGWTHGDPTEETSGAVGANCRAYYELFDGLACDDRITDLHLKLKVGGQQSCYYSYLQYSVYGRAHLNGANLVTLARGIVRRRGSSSVNPQTWPMWDTITIDETGIDAHAVRCIVVKLETLAFFGAASETVMGEIDYSDQRSDAQLPPWGVRILEASVYASPLGTDVTVPRVVRDIVSPWWSGERFFCPDEGDEDAARQLDQLVFDALPKTRLEALQEVDELLDWDYEATRDHFTYRKPVTLSEARDDELYPVSLADPHMQAEITPDMDECFNGLRGTWTSKSGAPKEVIVHGESETLGTAVVTRVFQLPESLASRAQATRIATRKLSSHLEPPIAGAPDFTGVVTVASGEDRDCLLMRPGELVHTVDAPRTFRRTERVISGVSLNLLTREAGVELGARSRKFDKWLARRVAKGLT